MQISFFLVMNRREDTCSEARPCANLFRGQKIHEGSTTDCGFEAVYWIIFFRDKEAIIMTGNNEHHDE